MLNARSSVQSPQQSTPPVPKQVATPCPCALRPADISMTGKGFSVWGACAPVVNPEALEREVYHEGALQQVGAPSAPGSLAITKPRPLAGARMYLPRLMTQNPNPCGGSQRVAVVAGRCMQSGEIILD